MNIPKFINNPGLWRLLFSSEARVVISWAYECEHEIVSMNVSLSTKWNPFDNTLMTWAKYVQNIFYHARHNIYWCGQNFHYVTKYFSMWTWMKFEMDELFGWNFLKKFNENCKLCYLDECWQHGWGKMIITTNIEFVSYT